GALRAREHEADRVRCPGIACARPAAAPQIDERPSLERQSNAGADLVARLEILDERREDALELCVAEAFDLAGLRIDRDSIFEHRPPCRTLGWRITLRSPQIRPLSSALRLPIPASLPRRISRSPLTS